MPLLFALSPFYASANIGPNLTVLPVASTTDNLIGATNTQWNITATTTANIMAGGVLQFFLPSVNQAQPFDAQTVTLISETSNIALYAHPSNLNQAHGVGFGGEGGTIIYGFATTTIPQGTVFTIRLGGIRNAAGQLSSMSGLVWTVKAGTTTDVGQPFGGLVSPPAFNQTSTESLLRLGGGLVSDVNSAITPSTTATGTAASYTFSIKTATSVPIGGKIVINFPTEFSLQNATTTVLAQNINGAGALVANGAIATTTGNGMNRVILTTSGAVVEAGDVITVTVGGLTNPTTAGVYRPFFINTTKANNGLIDGSYFGFEPSDYGSGAPPPNDTVHIGGKNTLIIQVRKQSGGSTVALSGGELTQVKVGAGCPDKQFFIGERWLDANSSATYNKVLDCNYIVGVAPFSAGDTSFFNTFLPPGFKSVNTVTTGGVGQTATTTLVFGVPSATATLALTGGVAGQNAFINAFSNDFMSFSPVFTTTAYTTPGFDGSGNGYAQMKITKNQDWNFTVFGGAFDGGGGNFSDTNGNVYWPPVIPTQNIATTSANPTQNIGAFAYVLANKNLVVTLTKSGSANTINDACVGVKRSGGGLFMGAQDVICQPNYDNDANSSLESYRFKVPAGTIIIEVSRFGFGAPEEFSVGVSAATTTKSIAFASPTSFIRVTAVTSDGVALNGAPVFAYGSSGFGNAMTGTTGTTTIYVPPGTYTVEGFAPAFGPLTAQSAVVTSDANPSITFTVNVGSLKTISGTVTQGGSGIAGVKIGAHGTGATTGGNGAETDASGNYTLYVPAGTYEVGGWSEDVGGLPPQAVDVSGASATNVNWSVNAQGTLRLEIQNASTIDQLFGGAFDSTTGRGNGTNSWAASSTSKVANVALPAGTYDVHVGSPSLGEFGSQTGVVITAGQTTIVMINAQASATLVTLSGTTTLSGVAQSGINVWASRIGAPGFFSAQTDANGEYFLKVPTGFSYRVGVRSLTYLPTQGDVDVNVSGNTTQLFTLTSAGGTITGRVLTSGASGIANAWVSAMKTSATTTQTGAPTDADGNYTLNVDTGSTWSLVAEGPCYPRSAAISASEGDTNKNITLTLQSGCTAPVPQVNGITASAGGQVSKNDLVLDIPANALGSSQNTVSVSISDADTAVPSANATPIDGSVQTISATDSTGAAITSLNSNITLTLTYDPALLPVGFTESNMQLGYFDTNTGQWEPVAATIDTTLNTFTASISHFTDYGPILPGVPDAPTNLVASAASGGIDLSWTASPTATTYTIYRSLTNTNFTTAIATGVTGTTYTNTGLTGSTLYYYKVAGVNGNGEGPSSSSANATTQLSGGGQSYSSGGVTTTTTTTTTTTATTTATTTTAVATTTPATTAVAATPATPAVLAIPATWEARQALIVQILAQIEVLRAELVKLGGASPNANALLNANVNASFKRDLSVGVTGDDVQALQVWLNVHGYTLASSGPGSSGNETTRFGALTRAALAKFQTVNGIKPSLGYFGPKTRAFLGTIPE
ncbi:MAG: hypothetical protein A3C93_05975 [Candidatus Lloydbacteria bacterium RIFCSPHIGHO2_02_FULL_54_17]|uniref:Fibronectin type-III domain-containing protein n=1 Tax=Candidatus Lloydbacteria bacterium RIFCSPHIGHO2_02_FULL_54_17 TaxID=1798664 RepID=A0A1G2DEB0_9BACT|nr:MAG: hypothetical protein A3C93_05975 [Candidatus Lloydbacteria bacterium RIFCSPHIGHO2_02_FULL_54_17]